MLQRRRQPGLDADHLDAALVPGGDAADQAAAADRDQQRIEVGRLLLELEADAARAQHGLDLVEGVHGQRARLGDIGLARRQRLGVDLAADGQVGAVAADARDLGRRGDLRHEDARLVAEPHGRVGHRRAVIAAGRRGDAGGRHLAQQQIGERPARLEGARVLRELELQDRREAREPEVLGRDLEHGRAADVRADALVGGGDRRRA